MKLDSKSESIIKNMSDENFVDMLKMISESPKGIKSNHDVRSQSEAETNFSTLLAATISSTLVSELNKYENVAPSANKHLLSNEEKLFQLSDLLSKLDINHNGLNKFVGMGDFIASDIILSGHLHEHYIKKDDINKTIGMGDCHIGAVDYHAPNMNLSGHKHDPYTKD